MVSVIDDVVKTFDVKKADKEDLLNLEAKIVGIAQALKNSSNLNLSFKVPKKDIQTEKNSF